ncbi:RES family NAD+ phosphorylase [Rhodococcus globerulus]|uniref:RES family NAD+ phosphorylase n=1 Tax=Rhodococcus globerulus TaxID=33008 RepID=UPI00374F8934
MWRVHSSRRSALPPNPTAQPDELSGGRFDSLDGTYAYLYIADSPDGAIAETICRDLPLDPTATRIVPASAVTSHTVTALTLTRTVTVAALHGSHLSAVGQDLWLTKCEARHYVTTRKWAHAIHVSDPCYRWSWLSTSPQRARHRRVFYLTCSWGRCACQAATTGLIWFSVSPSLSVATSSSYWS